MSVVTRMDEWPNLADTTVAVPRRPASPMSGCGVVNEGWYPSATSAFGRARIPQPTPNPASAVNRLDGEDQVEVCPIIGTELLAEPVLLSSVLVERTKN